MIGREHLEPARQEPVELVPPPGPARGVQKQQRLAFAGAQQVDAAARELKVLSGRCLDTGLRPVRDVRQRATSDCAK
jgi:hypothetical protein